MVAQTPENFASYNRRYGFVAFVGLLASAYLTFHYTEVTHDFQIGQSFCSINRSFDCETVARSPYARFAGIPVSFFAMTYYLFFAVYVLFAKSWSDIKAQARFGNLVLALAVVGLVPSVVLLLISIFALHTYCLLCLILDLVNFLLAVLAVRAPYRESTLADGIFQGVGELFASFIPALKPPRIFSFVQQAILWFIVVLSVLGGRRTEDFLVQTYFLPRAQAMLEKDTLLPFLEAWRKAPDLSDRLTVRTEGSSMERDYFIGSPNAIVTVVGFSDYECPFCRLMSAHVKDAMKKYSQDVRYVFKDYPLDMSCNDTIKGPKHQFACLAAKFARCAGEQGPEHFVEAHDSIYSMGWVTQEGLEALTPQLGLDAEKMKACVESSEVQNRIIEDVELGKKVHILATPTIYINGRMVPVPPKYFPGVLQMIVAEVKNGGPQKAR